MVGRIMTKRIMPASRRPTPSLGPSKRPVQPRGRSGTARCTRATGGEHDQPPQPVDHAGDRREELDRGRRAPAGSVGGPGRRAPGRCRARSGTASTTAMAVVSRVPRMKGSSPYWSWTGPRLLEDPREAERRERRPRLDDMEMRNHDHQRDEERA